MRTFNNEKAIKPYRFVKLTGSVVENATASKDNIIGISDSIASVENDIADIYITAEIANIEAGSAFSAGDALTADSEGRAIKASEGDNIGAIAYQDASAQGDIIQAIVSIERNLSANVTGE